MPKVNEVIKMLKDRYDEDEVIAFGIWTKKDIQRVSKVACTKLDTEQINEVLDILTEDFDPIIGINDEIIQETISDQDEDEFDDYNNDDPLIDDEEEE